MLRRIVLAWLLISGSAVKAEWLHTSEDDAFTGTKHIALVADDDTGCSAGFSCTTLADIVLVFITPERLDLSSAKMLHSLPTSLLVIVDDQEKLSFRPKADLVPGTEQLRFVYEGPGLLQLVRTVTDAKRRFALAVEIHGKIVHSKTFSADGSTSALTAFGKGCGLLTKP